MLTGVLFIFLPRTENRLMCRIALHLVGIISVCLSLALPLPEDSAFNWRKILQQEGESLDTTDVIAQMSIEEIEKVTTPSGWSKGELSGNGGKSDPLPGLSFTVLILVLLVGVAGAFVASRLN